MENRTKTLVWGGLISLLLLVSFGALQQNEAKFLTLASQWIFISIMPILVALFAGGYITKFKGFGVELETALKASVATSVELKATDAIADIPGDDKQSISYLNSMPRDKALSIKWLVFDLGRQGYYSPHGIREYFEKLPNIEFVEVRTDLGEFVCYIPIEYFKRDSGDPYDRFDMEKLERFIHAIAHSNILEEFAGVAISLKVKSTSGLVEVLKAMRAEHVTMAAVISESGKYLGVLFSQDVERKVADAVLSAQSS